MTHGFADDSERPVEVASLLEPIEVTVGRTDAMVAVVVRNHGSGVTPGDTNAILDRYWQQDAGSAGAGLGLYISRGWARAPGRDITVQPRQG